MPTKYAKVSDAIEAGWADLKQETGGHFSREVGSRLEAVCALGAACLAAGAPVGQLSEFDVYFPRLTRPFPKKYKKTLEKLNGYHKGEEVKPRWHPDTVETVADAIIVLNDVLKLPKETLIAAVRSWRY